MGCSARQRGRHARGGQSPGKGKDVMRFRHVQGGNVSETVFGQRPCAESEAGTWNGS